MILSSWMRAFMAATTVFIALPCFSQPLWFSNSLSLLSGNDYKLTPDNSAEVLTFEHASNYEAGDLFLFIDRFRYDSGDDSTYAEFSPRLTLKSNGLADASFIREILLAGTWEHGSPPGKGAFNNYLLGIGLDFSIPHTKYSKANVYYRNNDNRENNWQLTLNFAIPWQVKNQHFLYDGFIDWVPSANGVASSANVTTQLKWDISRYWQQTGQFYLGIEYVYWKNKYGISGITEHNPNLLLKFHF